MILSFKNFSYYMNLLQQLLSVPNPAWKRRRMLSIGSYMRLNCILLYTFPAIGIRVIRGIKSFICFEAFFGIEMMMFPRHCFGVSVWFRTPSVISRTAECKESPRYFKSSTVIVLPEPGDLLFFIDFIAVMSSSFVKFGVPIFRSYGASGMFDVSTRSLELFKSSSIYFSHSSTNSSLFAGGSQFLLFTFVALFATDFPVMCLMMKNGLDDWFRVLCFVGFNTFLLQIISLVVHH